MKPAEIIGELLQLVALAIPACCYMIAWRQKSASVVGRLAMGVYLMAAAFLLLGLGSSLFINM